MSGHMPMSRPPIYRKNMSISSSRKSKRAKSISKQSKFGHTLAAMLIDKSKALGPLDHIKSGYKQDKGGGIRTLKLKFKKK